MMQASIRDCPKLYFPSQEGRMRLHTDASDYGIGAYLYQEVGKPYTPIVDRIRTRAAQPTTVDALREAFTESLTH